MKGIALLKGTVKHYDWGGTDFIPSLLTISNTEKKPFAEYWLGVHPLATCTVQPAQENTISLRELIAGNKRELLGKNVFSQFGDMPYLLKTLDVKDMLSIQVHPSKEEAAKGFARENEAGIPIDSPKRNYKDANHKPELLVALGEFWLLHGFKEETPLRKILQDTIELNFLLPVFEQQGYAGLYREVMTMDQQQVDTVLRPLLNRIIPLYQNNELEKKNEDFWAARAAITFSHRTQVDRGIFSVYLFNLVELQQGEAVFQAAGVPHAYLEGQNVEIMANSDNVLRGGLTTKNIDVEELLRHVKCEPTQVVVLQGEENNDHERIYPTPAPDFELSCFALNKSSVGRFVPHTAEIVLVTEGSVNAIAGEQQVQLHAGQPALIVFPGQEVHLQATANTMAFRATVPIV